MRIEKPLTKEQAKAGDLIPAGKYAFTVIDALETFSKSGNPMIKLKLKIFMPDGKERVKFDYIMEALEYKMAHFFEAVDLWDQYEAGEIDADDCIGRSGELEIYIQQDKTGQYGDQSSVKDYILNDTQQAAKQERKTAAAKGAAQEDPGFKDSDIPF